MPYLGKSPELGVRTRYYYTVSAGATSVSGNDDNSKSLIFSDGEYVDVSLNGTTLVAGTDYNTTTANTIAGISAMAANDVVEVVVYDVFSVFSGDISGDLAVGGSLAVSGDYSSTTSGTSNLRLGVNAGNSIASGGNYNVVLGDEAGTALSTSDDNVAVGFEALSTEDAYGGNTAVGYRALKTLNAGEVSYNTAIGHTSGTAMTTGVANNTIGGLAGDALTTGSYNNVLGVAALSADTQGSRTIAIGHGALAAQNLSTATDTYNIAIGHNAGDTITTGVHNIIIGGLAGDSLTDADFNVAIGTSALGADTLGSKSVAIGEGTLQFQNFSTATDSFNVAVGYEAGNDITTAVQNVCVGGHAGAKITTGNYNVCLGNTAGNHGSPITDGTRNIMIGAYAHTSSASAADQLVMGYNVTSAGDSNFTFGNAGTDSNIAFGATSITAPSDVRLKENIEDEKVGLNFINDLRPVTFQWKKAKDVSPELKVHDANSDDRVMNGKYNHGFIAQEVKEVINNYPDLKDGFDMWIEDEIDGRQRIGESSLIPMLVKAIQELSAKVKKLEDG